MRNAHHHAIRWFSVGLAILMLLFSMNLFAGEFLKGSGETIPNQYIVTFKPNTARNMTFGSRSDLPEVARVAEELLAIHGVYSDEILHVYENALEGFAVRMDEEAAKAMADDPRVLFVEQDGIGYAADIQQNATWGIDRIDQKDLPLSKTYEYTTKASNVHVYVLDTGLYDSHTEFSGRVGNGYDAVGDGNGTLDQHGHGTHCAGTILGTQWGVAKGATIHPVQILDSNGSGQWSQIAAGADWVTRNHQKPAVASMSLQGTGFPTATVTAINGMINAGVFVVGAAGNYDVDACTHIMGSTNCMTVAASNSSDSRWTSSNWGSCVEIFAPGENVTSASHTSTTGSKIMSGTSMATPHVAGVAALYLANNPNATPSQVQKAILDGSTANKITDVKGSPNKLAYSLIGGSPTPGVTADFDYRADKLKVSFTDKSTVTGTTITSWEWAFGDGGASRDQNPVYTYTKAGTYRVTLKVSDGKQSDDIIKEVTVSDQSSVITADFEFRVSGLSVTFTDKSTSSASTITSWRWAFGEGGRSDRQNPTYTYAKAGTYNVTLTVSDGTTSDDVVKSVTVSDSSTQCEAPWQNLKIYYSGDKCSYNGRNWQAKMIVVGQAPVSGSMWWSDLGSCR